MNETAPPIANKFGAFGRGSAPFAGQQAPPRYLDVEDFLKRVSPLSFLSLFAARKGQSPRNSKPARSTSYLTQTPKPTPSTKGGCGT